ncbi:MAG TPA: alpha/beta fold hydrolase [Polyangia bacterium]|jgi:pimeloyl-ACP methyl ester carboxylesterase
MAHREHHMIDAGGARLHVVTEGQGPLVLLLHGFPEFWFSWRHQMGALAAAGFRAAAPDLRGYGRSEKPRGVGAYRLEALAADVAGLIRALGGGPATVVGHDWGGAVAWHAAARYPALVERLVVMNGPAQGAMLRAFLSPRQIGRSWYIFFFQLPRLPERMVLREGFMRQLFRANLADPDAIPEHELNLFDAALHEPGAATAAINYYRAAIRHPLIGAHPVACPTLIVWGARDRALGPEVLAAITPLAPRRTVHVLEDAGHFVHEERPHQVNRLLLDFLGAEARTAATAPTA